LPLKALPGSANSGYRGPHQVAKGRGVLPMYDGNDAARLLGFLVLMTAPGAEDVVESRLRAAGADAYCPRYRRRLAGVRIDEATGRRIRTRQPGGVIYRPLFKSYVMAALHVDEDTYAIAHMAGVVKVLRRESGTPRLLPVEIVDEIRARVDSGEFDEIAPGPAGKPGKRLDIAAGDRVRTARGAIGELLHLDEAGRAVLLMTWLGADRVTRVNDASELELVRA